MPRHPCSPCLLTWGCVETTTSGSLSTPAEDLASQGIAEHPQYIQAPLLPGNDYVFEDAGHPRVYSAASTINLLRSIADLTAAGVPQWPHDPGRAVIAALETPLCIPTTLKPLDWLSAMLPPQRPLHDLIAIALDQALITAECIDRDDFWARLADMLGPHSGVGSPSNRSLLALVYALLALGERYKRPPERRPSDSRRPSDEPRG